MQDRIKSLNQVKIKSGQCVVYIMSRDQRLQDNHALLAAQQDAITQKLPLYIYFNLLPKSGVRAREHFIFMLDGLKELSENAHKLNIGFVIWHGKLVNNLEKFCKEYAPASLYFDFSPLNGPRQAHKLFAKQADIPCYEVDTHNIIPVYVASDHQEFAAHTFRSKVHALLAKYLIEPEKLIRHPFDPIKADQPSWQFEDLLNVIPANKVTYQFTSGEAAAHAALKKFIENKLAHFAQDRNNPTVDGTSNLSPYLHYGHISSLRVALEVLSQVKHEPLLFREARMASAGQGPSLIDGMNALFEEMIVRKELSDNFCFFAKSYDTFAGAPAWATDSLAQHIHDNREYAYTLSEWEQAKTHDPAWNAAQKQLTSVGKMHGYMRMYWAKKILEWSKTPEDALKTALYLNDHYSIDGGDPNGYVGILWSIAGLHDRPWTERPVFGKIRYMNYEGLKRKFDIESYCKKWLTES